MRFSDPAATELSWASWGESARRASARKPAMFYALQFRAGRAIRNKCDTRTDTASGLDGLGVRQHRTRDVAMIGRSLGWKSAPPPRFLGLEKAYHIPASAFLVEWTRWKRSLSRSGLQGERPLSLNGALFGFVATHERSERSLLGSERQQYITCDAGPPITGVHENHSTRYHRTWTVE